MPMHDEFEQFMCEYRALTKDKRRLFRQSVRAMNEDMKAGRPFRNSLRIKGVQGHKGVFEMTWAGDGGATFMYGLKNFLASRILSGGESAHTRF